MGTIGTRPTVTGAAEGAGEPEELGAEELASLVDGADAEPDGPTAVSGLDNG
jgi:hypothetical protein